MPLSDDHLITIVRSGNLLTPEQVREAREEARKSGRPMLDVVKEHRWLDDAEIASLEAMAAYTPPPQGTVPGLSEPVTPATRVPESGAATVLGSSAGSAEAQRPTAVPDVRGTPGSGAVRASGATPAPRGVAHYDIVREVGRGGMGVVYEAFDRKLARRVALKKISVEGRPGLAQRLVREARSAARLQHPNVLQVYDVGEENGSPYVALEYVEGESLEEKIRNLHAGRERATLKDLVEILRQAALGLDFAHKAGVVHRDVKPANILVGADGRARIGDFGLARDDRPASGSDIRLTVEGAVMGTPGYLSPEQAAGRAATPGSDVYALGACLFEILTDRLPFEGGALADVLVRIATQDAPSPSRLTQRPVPADLERVCLKALAREPADRYPTAAAFSEDLGRWLADQPVQARPEVHGDPIVRAIRRNPGRAVIVIVLLAIFAAVTLARQRRRREREAAEDKGKAEENAAPPRDAAGADTALTLAAADRALAEAAAALAGGAAADPAPRAAALAGATRAAELAEKQYAQARAADPKSAAAALGLGRARRWLGREETRQALDDAVALRDTPDARLERALAAAGRALEALFPPGVAGMEAVDPKAGPVLRLEDQPWVESARADLKAAEAGGAADGPVFLARAMLAVLDRDLAGAATHLRAARAVSAGDPDFHYTAALTALYSGDPHGAADAFDVLFDLQPRRPRTRLQRPLAAIPADLPLAESLARAAHDLCPGDPRADLLLAEILVRRGTAPGAQEACDLLRPHLKGEGRIAASVTLAAALLRLDRRAEAADLIRQTRSGARTDAYHAFQIGRLLLLCGEKDEGRRVLEAFLKANPGHPLRGAAEKLLGE